jgi:hypothetical protein
MALKHKPLTCKKKLTKLPNKSAIMTEIRHMFWGIISYCTYKCLKYSRNWLKVYWRKCQIQSCHALLALSLKINQLWEGLVYLFDSYVASLKLLKELRWNLARNVYLKRVGRILIKFLLVHYNSYLTKCTNVTSSRLWKQRNKRILLV